MGRVWWVFNQRTTKEDRTTPETERVSRSTTAWTVKTQEIKFCVDLLFFFYLVHFILLSTRNLDEVFLENLEGEKKSTGSVVERQKDAKLEIQIE